MLPAGPPSSVPAAVFKDQLNNPRTPADLQGRGLFSQFREMETLSLNKPCFDKLYSILH